MLITFIRLQDKFLICLVPTTLAVAEKYWVHLTAKVVSTVAFQNKIKNLSCTPFIQTFISYALHTYIRSH